MPWKYNPFTDALDQTGSGGGTSYIDGEVEYHSNLPVTVGSPAVNSAFLVRKGEGLYFISRKPAGIWVRELNNGNLDDWKFAGLFSDLYRDANFRILNNADVSKELAFDVSGVTTGTTRTLTVPNGSGTISLQGHTHVSANITDATSDETPNTIVKRDAYGNARFNGIQVTDVTPPLGEVWLAGFDDSGTVAAISPEEAREYSGLGTTATVTFGSLQNTPIGSTTKSTGAFTTLSAAPTSGSALTLTGGTVTASAPLIDATQTWNDAAVAFRALRVNVTNTASASTSLLADFQVGGTNVLSINRAGALGAGGAGWLLFSSAFGSAATPSGVWNWGNTSVAINAQASLGSGSGAIQLGSTASIGWSSNTAPTVANADLRLFRDAADTLAQYRGTNAQTFRIYNSFTSTTNFERLSIGWSSNIVSIKPEAGGGGGTVRALHISGLPTSNPGPGILWNDSNTVKVGT